MTHPKRGKKKKGEQKGGVAVNARVRFFFCTLLLCCCVIPPGVPLPFTLPARQTHAAHWPVCREQKLRGLNPQKHLIYETQLLSE